MARGKGTKKTGERERVKELQQGKKRERERERKRKKEAFERAVEKGREASAENPLWPRCR